MKRTRPFASPYRVLTAALFTGVLALIFAQTSSVGLADNGDFPRLTQAIVYGPQAQAIDVPSVHTAAYDLRFYQYWIPLWHADIRLDRVASSTSLLWLPGVLVSLLHDSHVISLPAVGAGLKILVVLLFGAFLLLASADIVLTIFFGVCFGLMLSTADYTAYYNSFYYEAPSSIFLFFVLLALAGLVRRVTTARIMLFLVAAALLGACKLQYTYLWLLSFGFLLWIVYRAGRLNVRTAVAVGAFGVAVGLPPMYNLWRASTVLGLFHYNDYNRVYDGILAFSDDPRRLLRIVGANDVTCVGTVVFEPAGIRCAEQYPASFSRANTLRLLAAEPVIVPRMIGFAADSMQDLSLEYLGKYERGDPRVVTLPRTGPNARVSAIRRDFYSQYPGPPWNLWSAVKYRLFPRGIALFAFLLSAMVFFMFVRDSRVSAPLRYAGVFSVLVCYTQMVVDVFGDGKEEMIKHLYLANVAFDVSLILLAAGILMLARNARPDGFTLISNRRR